MKSEPLFYYSLLVFYVVPALCTPTSANDDAYKDNACVSRHQNAPGKLSAVAEEWKRSIHFRNNVTCDGCHGGDPSVKREQFDNEEIVKDRSHLQRDREFLLMSRTDSPFTSEARVAASAISAANAIRTSRKST